MTGLEPGAIAAIVGTALSTGATVYSATRKTPEPPKPPVTEVNLPPPPAPVPIPPPPPEKRAEAAVGDEVRQRQRRRGVASTILNQGGALGIGAVPSVAETLGSSR